jgi:hypothetical protein
MLNIKTNLTNCSLQFFLPEHLLDSQNDMLNLASQGASRKIGHWLMPNEVVLNAGKDLNFRDNKTLRPY